MAIVAKASGGDFEKATEGVYIARCFKIIDLGTQTSEWAGETKHQRKVMVTWELLEDSDGEPVRMSDGERPFAISKTYTLSLHDKAELTKDLQSWRGKKFTETEKQGFDITNLLEKYCMVQVVHNDKGYANVSTIMFTNKKPAGVNPAVLFEIENPDMEVFESLSDFTKDKIRSAPEFQEGDEVQAAEDMGEPISPKDLAEIPF